MNKKKVLATTLALSLSFSAIAPSISAKAADSPNGQLPVLITNNTSHQDFIEFIKSDPDAFGDPVFTEEVVRKLEAASSQGQYETMGKVTLAAKAGAKAIKATMQKIGRAKWDEWVDKMESFHGIPMSYLHYQGVTHLVDLLSNSDDSFKAAISKYFISKGMNRIMANIITNVFVTFVL
ncbi:hypothetical protein [Exiguobacterium sp. s142]|uniref:hypothetical protein n=1 Tax=Exiguobacterium sp. s142 TaxID=2751222 RepID=UPI001BE508E0|nr:hypothetical protein [Exiguobacterium sp. s142]